MHTSTDGTCTGMLTAPVSGCRSDAGARQHPPIDRRYLNGRLQLYQLCHPDTYGTRRELIAFRHQAPIDHQSTTNTSIHQSRKVLAQLRQGQPRHSLTPTARAKRRRGDPTKPRPAPRRCRSDLLFPIAEAEGGEGEDPEDKSLRRR